jgi:hypothetical protein
VTELCLGELGDKLTFPVMIAAVRQALLYQLVEEYCPDSARLDFRLFEKTG